jgi:hypothetical protein
MSRPARRFLSAALFLTVAITGTAIAVVHPEPAIRYSAMLAAGLLAVKGGMKLGQAIYPRRHRRTKRFIQLA